VTIPAQSLRSRRRPTLLYYRTIQSKTDGVKVPLILMDTIFPTRFCPDNLFAYEQNSQAIMWDPEHAYLPIGRSAGHKHEAFQARQNIH